ncbi:Gfo/Idh/MocA family oxidoreductase [Halobacterium sp. KA-4]|uniref:D-xylose 1-dehydrogenase Gfo6 n=1 Tax=Halobacterium sp. KA-4 TaxID=2896367 RepID=UPI001E489FF1|nr:D-xylose 1-dehydrogenase Gfo6 [Halobacterium sp. KA-4]MCD2201454.1 Gfo/Idh/MocA family oxidoreductase [Halobacterium sp. KA-4]
MGFRQTVSSFTDRDWQQTTDGTVRLALVGLGWWTIDEAIPAIQDTDLCEVTVLVSRSQEKAQRFADEADVPHAISGAGYHDGECADEYDAIYVATPNAYHLEYVETAAELGKAVLCEKPMEASVERAEQMVEVADDASIPLMVAYRMHTEPAVRRARELVDSGVIGEPVQVYGNNSQPLLSMIEDPDQWRLDPDASGYGTSMMDLGIYPINTARFILGSDPVSVQAQMTSMHDAFADVPDERSTATVVYDDGVHAAITATQNAYNDTELTITGTDGQLTLSPAFHMECELAVETADRSFSASADDINEMTEEFDYFADRVLSSEPVYADGEHGLYDMRVLKALHESADTGRTVDLE